MAVSQAIHLIGFPLQDNPKPKPLFIDPHHEPVKTVDLFAFHPWQGHTFDVTLCGLLPTAVEGNKTVRDAVVTGRMRLDLGTARAMFEGLRQQIAIAEASVATKN